MARWTSSWSSHARGVYEIKSTARDFILRGIRLSDTFDTFGVSRSIMEFAPADLIEVSESPPTRKSRYRLRADTALEAYTATFLRAMAWLQPRSSFTHEQWLLQQTDMLCVLGQHWRALPNPTGGIYTKCIGCHTPIARNGSYYPILAQGGIAFLCMKECLVRHDRIGGSRPMETDLYTTRYAALTNTWEGDEQRIEFDAYAIQRYAKTLGIDISPTTAATCMRYCQGYHIHKNEVETTHEFRVLLPRPGVSIDKILWAWSLSEPDCRAMPLRDGTVLTHRVSGSRRKVKVTTADRTVIFDWFKLNYPHQIQVETPNMSVQTLLTQLAGT